MNKQTYKLNCFSKFFNFSTQVCLAMQNVFWFETKDENAMFDVVTKCLYSTLVVSMVGRHSVSTSWLCPHMYHHHPQSHCIDHFILYYANTYIHHTDKHEDN